MILRRLRRIAWIPLLALVLSTFPPAQVGPFGARRAEAAPLVSVRLIIEGARALDSIDDVCCADFFMRVTLDGNFTETNRFNDRDVLVDPGWIFTTPVDLALKTSIQAHLELWDFDTFLNGADNKIDINDGAARDLDITISLNPCNVTGTATGANGLCGTSLAVSGNGDERAELRYRVEVDYPTVANLRMRCTHSPVWPQPGQQVTINVEALDGALNPTPVTKIELWFNTQATAPTDTASGASQLSPAPKSLPSGAQNFFYGCMVTSGPNAVWSGWRRVQIGPPPASQGRAVPISYTGSSDGRIDFVFIPDSNSYPGGATDANFLTDVRDVIRNAYYARDVYLRNQDITNFWIAQDTGTTTLVPDASGGNNCANMPPANFLTTYPFVDAGALLHRPTCRDNASPNIRLFSVEPTSLNVVVHESGHQPFGLADEYCCDGGYFPQAVNGNVFNSQASCQADALAGSAADTCRQITNATGSVSWWRLDSAATAGNDLMIGNGDFQAADTRRHDWLFGQCRGAKC